MKCQKGLNMKDLYIIGAGGFGREVAWLVKRINQINPTWNLKGFIDDNESRWGSKEGNYPVYGGCEYLKAQGAVYAVCAIGSAKIRKRVIEKLNGSSVRFATLVDPSVLMSDRIILGEGSIICAGTILTVDIKIGNHVIINLNSTVGHDAVLDDFVTIYPSVNVSGMTHLGECSEYGTGMQIIQGIKVAENTIIGAGAVVVRNIEEEGVYAGCPARKVR